MDLSITVSFVPCELCNKNICEYNADNCSGNEVSIDYPESVSSCKDSRYYFRVLVPFYETDFIDYSEITYCEDSKYYFRVEGIAPPKLDKLDGGCIGHFSSPFDVNVCKGHGTLLLELELLQALMMFFSNKDKNVLYVNVYRVTQAYGGREEGGWYYDRGEVVDFLPVTTPFYLGTEDAVETNDEYGYLNCDEDGPVLESPYPRTIGYAQFLEECFPHLFKLYQHVEEFKAKYADKGSKRSYTSVLGGHKYEVGLDYDREGYPRQPQRYS